ncbi:photosynthetic reaction center subunit H [Acidiphilium acidophilum]|uniref:Photosynthetic reaction center subunit H n=1 Tax=Acidiphilium acidophilum TaxID=76588 RepID=A0AAW9DTW1_ACIAO|nr:photosynthetic reaction center subunit H [Acidiphilium acidophilum]MDX5932138.1 photosynthetic reaction center subunit H [Acidiphilium acidophilum]
MQTGAITPYIDVAQLVLYAFWIFFFGLVIYLQRESKREGYPLVTGHKGKRLEGFPPLPSPKTFLLPDGQTKTVPWNEPIEVINARPSAPWDGAPIIPLGNPMLDGIGPAAYTQRGTDPERMPDGEIRIVPLRVATDHWVAAEDPDPRGAPVICCDGTIGGTVTDIWIDRADQMPLWIEASVTADPARRVMFPIALCRVISNANPFDNAWVSFGSIVSGSRGRSGLPRSASGVSVKLASVTAAQFAIAPGIAHPDIITPREEDRLMAYFASGHLYATAARSEPLL